ncbi:Uncharacterised protein [Orientia tsutsugamushi]|uniref:Uncharacterized protein n=1 Tax=Orientia tsutsugamushi TaxID=784 RepID=A0A2R8F323_ORITS|nr:Uncharacterised protein [Orientia tsutsugamushi]
MFEKVYVYKITDTKTFKNFIKINKEESNRLLSKLENDVEWCYKNLI